MPQAIEKEMWGARLTRTGAYHYVLL
jgi:hypothetical protein